MKKIVFLSSLLFLLAACSVMNEGNSPSSVTFEKDNDPTHHLKELQPGIAGEVYVTEGIPAEMEFYRILRTGAEQFSERANFRPVFTNDPSRQIESLELVQATKDVSTYIPLQVLGQQAVNGMVGYSDGYLVQFPFKFPVDKSSFQTVQRKAQFRYGESDDIPAIEDVSGGLRRPRFVNGGVVYYKYLGDDKNWVYAWIGDDSQLRIIRIKKADDFSFLPMQEGETFDLMMLF